MTAHSGRTVYCFGEFRFDPAAYELRRGETRVRLRRQPMEALHLLLERHGELVRREELVRRLWPGETFVDHDAGIHTAILRIRQALGESPSCRFVETVPASGYRFAAKVAVQAHLAGVAEAVGDDGARATRRGNLPAELTSFVGREPLLTNLRTILAHSRLVSLIGTGGVGKTRLAVRLGDMVRGELGHGAWLVDLAAVSSPDLVPESVAAVLGIREQPGRRVADVLIDQLRERELLLLLDTCEHLVDGCAAFVGALLREAPCVRVLATTRESLNVPGEHVVRVPSLRVPDRHDVVTADRLMEFEAPRLFVERATCIDSSFAFDDRGAVSVAAICRRLDGIPLAIELAAARVAMLSLDQIEARLQDRFSLLTGGGRTAVPRQRTLEATVEWSYRLLAASERMLLARLSVFPSAWTLVSAEQVCAGDGLEPADVLDVLSRLAGKSLIVAEPALSGERRYRFLETVAHYARNLLIATGEADRVRDRHFMFVWNAYREAHPVLRGAGQVECLKRLDRDQDNLRAALDWGFTSPALEVRAVELAGALFWFWTKRGQFEEGKRWLARAATIAAPPAVRARALIGLAHMHDFQGSHDVALANAELALELGRAAGDPWAISVATFLQSLAIFQLGDHRRARDLAQAARQVADAGCAPIEHGGPLMILGNVTLIEGDAEAAQRLFDDSIAIHRQGGDAWGLSILLSIGAGLHIVRGDLTSARRHALEAMSLSEALEDPRGLAWSLEVAAGTLAAAGRAEDAARLWGSSDALLARGGGMLLPTIGWIRSRYHGGVKDALGATSFERLIESGRDLAPEAATALARDLAHGRTARRSIDRIRAPR